MFISNRKFIFALIVLGAVFVGLCIAALRMQLFPGDLRLETAFQSLENSTLTGIFKFLSWIFGDWHGALLVFPAGLLVWWRLEPKSGIAVWVAGLLFLSNPVIKAVIGRPRPSASQVKLMITETGPGFPSSHAFLALIFLGFLAYLLFTHLKNRAVRIISVTLLAILILAVGASRVYLGVHWPSDIIGGYTAGGFFLVLLIWGYKSLKVRF